MKTSPTSLLGHAAFATGLAALAWVALGALGTNPLALAVTLLIGAFFMMGWLELRRFQRGSRALVQALDRARSAPPADATAYAAWLADLPAQLPDAVRQRIDHGGRSALPGPALAPALTGLLVLLGMLGTFLGMVATLHGTGQALEHATELDALRDALAAPVKGLGLAFGTSVAGVATSAMLGLMTALARRERAEAAQALDHLAHTTLQPFSANHRAARQHDDTLSALRRQADAVPAIVTTTLTTMVDTLVSPLMERLHTLATALDQHQRQAQQRLLDDQAQFHARTEATFGALATSVERTLKDSLADGAQQAHALLQPLVTTTLAGLTREAGALHAELSNTVRHQVDGITQALTQSSATQATQWQQALADHRHQQQAQAEYLQAALAGFTTAFEDRAGALVQTFAARLEELQQGQQATWARHDAERLDAWRNTVAAMATDLRDSWQQAGERSAAQQQTVCDTLAATARDITHTTQSQARATVEEISRLLHAAAQAPRAAAEVIGELRERLTDAMARDNALLDERQRLLETLGTLLTAVNQASTDQRRAIEALVGTSSSLLQQAGEHLRAQADTHSVALAEATTRAQGAAVEMASLGEAFGFAVQRFGQSNEAMLAQLQRIEAALSQSLTRSDEQLAYYVAQAREVIDLSLSSQKQIIDDLHALGRREPA